MSSSRWWRGSERAVLLLALAGGAAGQDADLAARLEAVVDIAEPLSRAAAARELAAATDAGVDAWRSAIRAFHPTEAQAPGVRRLEVELWNGEALEPTELYLRVPHGYEPGVAHPLIVQAHGTGGSGRGQTELWAGPADAISAIVVAPSESGPNDGYRFSLRERQLTLAAIRWAQRRFHVDEDRIVLAGISRGGHLAWDLALRHPDRFAAIAPMIGSPRLNPGDGQNNLRFVENVVHLPIRDLQGARDDPRLIANLRFAFERLAALGAADARLIEFAELGHDFRMDAVDWVAWLGSVRRDPRPRRVLRLAADAREGRASWIEIVRLDDRKVAAEVRPRVPAKEWEALDEGGRRARVQREVDARTARVEAGFEQPGRINVTSTGVRELRVLLEPDMLDEGRVEVRWNGRVRRFRCDPDGATLLADFAERLDRRFLPVASVVLR